jgi:hypothetical protein
MMRVEDGAAGKPTVAIAVADTLVYALRQAMLGKDTTDKAIKAGVRKARDINTNKGEALDLIWGAGCATGYYMAIESLVELVEEAMKE